MFRSFESRKFDQSKNPIAFFKITEIEIQNSKIDEITVTKWKIHATDQNLLDLFLF